MSQQDIMGPSLERRLSALALFFWCYPQSGAPQQSNHTVMPSQRFVTINEIKKILLLVFLSLYSVPEIWLEFMEYLATIGYKPGTRNQRLAALKSHPWFAADKDITLRSIALSNGRVKACRNSQKEEPILDEEAL